MRRLAAASLLAVGTLLTGDQFRLLLGDGCTKGLRPEISDDLELDECMMLSHRVIWRSAMEPPLLLRQTMDRDSFFGQSQSTGFAVWSGGIVLASAMEHLGPNYWHGKTVLELGCGTAVGAITAAKLGAASVIATDSDAEALSLAAANARANLKQGPERAAFSTAVLQWGRPIPEVLLRPDIVIGADITYVRDAWPALAQTLRSLRAPALIAVTERRLDELVSLQDYLAAAGLRNSFVDPPTGVRGYAAERVRLLSIERARDDERCEFWTVDDLAPEPVLAVRCRVEPIQN